MSRLFPATTPRGRLEDAFDAAVRDSLDRGVSVTDSLYARGGRILSVEVLVAALERGDTIPLEPLETFRERMAASILAALDTEE